MVLPLERDAQAGTATREDAVLRCRGLVKRYGEICAVHGLSIEIRAGETYGLLGPNGAGKTTAISMIAGVLASDGGDIAVLGQPISVHSPAGKAKIGYVPQDVAVYPDLTARENLRFFASLYGLRGRPARTRIAEVLDTIGLTDRAGERVAVYSGGMKRRLNIGIGLLHRPSLLILDEPTVGVDPQSRNAILRSIEALSDQGMAVLYTTHYMEEAERLCDRIGIIDVGTLIAEGTARELTGLVGEHDRVRLTAGGDLAAAADALRSLPSVWQVTVGTDSLDLLDDDARTALPRILDTVSAAGALTRSVFVEEPDLEAVFLHLTGKSLRD
jgi:ABC-2 type transport system ATP-binding protein